MATFTVSIDTSNAAFENDPALEIARILDEISSRLDTGRESGAVWDVNGNRVGTFGWAE